ncbi:hypothetical protein ASPFODRAFT_492878 [Aspergillus luchuensis CBS 106.47]|uniref:Uncharacterized protein n=1 Tax=Aspergillus luchuensis (strain CBS 106.47) TaxID=1137211 RepID=A0A1M3TRJ8_ASPLC|nr:hypothetical protein ASPFODRAFT_492878 [Aspergillus luchuensis CBS 106.47]
MIMTYGPLTLCIALLVGVIDRKSLVFLQLATDVVDRDHVDEGVAAKKLLCLLLLEVSDKASNQMLYMLNANGILYTKSIIQVFTASHFLLQSVGQADQIDEKRVVRVDRG